MRKTLLHGFLLFLPFFSLAQNSLSGIINIYAAVTAIDTCTGTLTLEKATGFTAGMQVIVMQMQGALINNSNSANFGNISNLRSAGLYERARIRGVNGNQIELENTLLNRYNLDGSVQLISLPSYANAIVTDTLLAQAWDGAVGGVLALEVTDTLRLNAPIEASGSGFRGGIADIEISNNCNALTNANAFFYNLNNWRGASKGEGIAIMTPDREAGRGAQANGGGGGNDHNSGGGGGGNAGTGGRGGNNNEPNILGCDGTFPGLGGKALTDLENRLFLGGGGGAGHENNDLGTDGGNGGGIIILIAKNLEGNNFKIAANGITPPISNGDGGGGGGAGGTILLNIENVISSILIEAKGGDGGSIDNRNGTRCHGPGGGGSGGRLIASDALQISYNLSRGMPGMSKNSTSCGAGSNGAEPGGDGFQDNFTGIPQSEAVNTIPAIVSQPRSVPACVNQPLSIGIITNGAAVQYQWQVDKGDGIGFQNITDNDIYSNTLTSELIISNLQEQLIPYIFRVIITGSCFTPLQSEPIPLSVQPSPTAEFDVIIDNNIVNFHNLSLNADEYFWNFGDGQSSDLENPTHTFAQAGDYTITLTAINNCNSATFTKTITLNAKPVAQFAANVTQGCQPLSVTFENTSSTNATEFTWILPGATPNFSTQRNPTVTYNISGKYAVILIASNANGVDTLRQDSFIVVQSAPNPAFTIMYNDLTININNTSSNSTGYTWNFGDDATSTAVNPTHTYSKPGIYTISLTAINECGSQTITQTISVGAVPNALFTVNRPNGCAPHLVNFTDASSGAYESRVWEFPGGNPTMSTAANPQVIYNNPGQYDVTLIIKGALGNDTLRNIAYINVLPSPIPSFSYVINGNTVTFNNTSSNAQTYQWNFGDGQTSTQPNPTYTFSASGVYTITLNASNAYCGRSTSQTIAVGLNSTEDLYQSGIMIAPNPFHNQLFINSTLYNYQLGYQLYNIQGQVLQRGNFTGKTELNLSAFANGMYILQLQNEDKIWIAKIVKQ
ncbi:MAG: PKD domain-containing protein [Saprospiraceae bacterium]